MTSGKVLEKTLKANLIEYFHSLSFEYFHHYENSFFWKKETNIQYRLEIQSKSFSIGEYCELSITFWDIEDIIIDIELPHRTKIELLSYRDFRRTIIDPNLLSILNQNGLIKATSVDECIVLCKSIVDYMEDDGRKFFEKYSNLPNILEQMNILEKEGKNWNGLYGKGGILCGGFESNFVGLIISKLCNDADFERKFQYIESKATLKAQWLPYLEKLKERLKTVQPIYNI